MGAVDRIVIGKFIRRRDGQTRRRSARQIGQAAAQIIHQFIGGITIDTLIIMTTIVVAPIAAPVVRHDLCHRHFAHGQNVQPQQNRPETVLFANMVRSGARALLTAKGGAPVVQQVAKELPPRGRLITGDAQRLGHTIRRARCRHRPRDTGQTVLISGGKMRIRGQNGQTVGRGDIASLAHDHIAIPVTIGRGPEIGTIGRHHNVHQVLGPDRVRIGMAATEIGAGHGIHNAALWRAQRIDQNMARIGAGHRMHCIEPQGKATREQATDRIEIKQLGHEVRVIRDGIDNLNHHIAQRRFPDHRQIDVLCL